MCWGPSAWLVFSKCTCWRPSQSSGPLKGLSGSPFETRGVSTPAAATRTKASGTGTGPMGTAARGGSKAVALTTRTTAADTATNEGTGSPHARACTQSATAAHDLDRLSEKNVQVLFHVIQYSEWFRELVLADFEFSDIVACILNVVCAISFNTLKTYLCYVASFFEWYELKRGRVPSFPFSKNDIAMFLLSRVQSLGSVSSLTGIFSALKWAHGLYGNDSVFSEKFLHFLLKGLQRIVAKPKSKKKPVTRCIVEKVVKMFAHEESNLCHLRTALMFLMGFVGFLRISEILDLKVKDLFFHQNGDFLRINISKAKNDQLRTGNNVYIAAAGNNLCTVNVLCRYLLASGHGYDSDAYLFQTIIFKKSTKSYHLTGKKMSYSCARKSVKQALEAVGERPEFFGTHSLRAGGATAAAAAKVSRQLIQNQGRWKCAASMDGYIEHSVSDRLTVSRKISEKK